ncbi:MAG TPA: hypothetical protein VFS92_09695 [Planctomycetota bacterium]|nr:hypothetical protein [Planctomycetota bacterium]
MSAAGPETRRLLNEAVLSTLAALRFQARVVDLPEGDEIEVLCAPRVPLAGARFFLRVEAARIPARAGAPAEATVPADLAASWRAVPEPVGVVGLDPRTGAARLGNASALPPPVRKGRSRPVKVPLPEPLDDDSLPRLARRAADAHVLFRRVLGAATRTREAAPADLRQALARLREADFDQTLACLDLLREAGLLEEDESDRSLRATDGCVRAFAAAAVHHGLGARGHADPRAAADAGRSAVARVLLSRFPAAAEATVARCAVVLARVLPVDDADAIVELVRSSSDDEE